MTALMRTTLDLRNTRPVGDAEGSAMTERKMMLAAMEQMTLQLKQLRSDRDKLAGVQGDHVSQWADDGLALSDAHLVYSAARCSALFEAWALCAFVCTGLSHISFVPF